MISISRFEARFQEQPEQFASLAYDAMNALLDSICKAGLNRARIHDALADIEHYDGVTGHMVFDPNQKNVAPMYLGTVHDGKVTYRIAKMEKQTAPASASDSKPPVPYASLSAEDLHHAEPHPAGAESKQMHVVLFGPGAAQVAQSASMQEAARASQNGQSWIIDPVESSQNWGAASTQFAQALMDHHAVAVIALDRDTSHLAAQLALKCFVPVVALSDDTTLTSANVPWVFRLTAKTEPAAALRMLEEAASRGAGDPWRIRDLLASGNAVAGLSFLPTGEIRH